MTCAPEPSPRSEASFSRVPASAAWGRGRVSTARQRVRFRSRPYAGRCLATHEAGAATSYRGCVRSLPLHDLDLVELSDLAWGIVDPDGCHESEEQAWVALLGGDWRPVATIGELRARLDELAQALALPSPAVPLRVVAAVMTLLAAQPERPAGEERVLAEALDAAFGGALPADVAAWLHARHTNPGARRRPHGADRPRRHFHARPAAGDSRSVQ